MPNADPNDVLRKTPPETYAFLEALVGKLAADAADIEFGADDAYFQSREEAASELQRWCNEVRKVIRGLRERDVMVEWLVKRELEMPANVDTLFDEETDWNWFVAQEIRDEIEKQEHLWEIPKSPSVRSPR